MTAIAILLKVLIANRHLKKSKHFKILRNKMNEKAGFETMLKSANI